MNNKKKNLVVALVASFCMWNGANAAQNAVAMQSNAIPTGVLGLSAILGVGTATAITQITYPTVFAGPAFEGWYSTVRVCFDGASQLGINLATSVDARIEVVAENGNIAFALTNVNIPTGACKTYTSDIPTDPLFGGLTPGVYKVRVTNELSNIIALGSLNGTVNSTGRSVISH